MSEQSRYDEILTDACGQQGLTIDEYRDGDDGREAVLGRWKATHDIEPEGIFEGDAGLLTACVVGAPEYGNERVMFGLQPDDFDSPIEVDPMGLEPVGKT